MRAANARTIGMKDAAMRLTLMGAVEAAAAIRDNWP
jgi:hypothetical protein